MRMSFFLVVAALLAPACASETESDNTVEAQQQEQQARDELYVKQFCKAAKVCDALGTVLFVDDCVTHMFQLNSSDCFEHLSDCILGGCDDLLECADVYCDL